MAVAVCLQHLNKEGGVASRLSSLHTTDSHTFSVPTHASTMLVNSVFAAVVALASVNSISASPISPRNGHQDCTPVLDGQLWNIRLSNSAPSPFKCC